MSYKHINYHLIKLKTLLKNQKDKKNVIKYF